MFELYYRVVHSEYDDFVGQNGFFQIKCNLITTTATTSAM